MLYTFCHLFQPVYRQVMGELSPQGRELKVIGWAEETGPRAFIFLGADSASGQPFRPVCDKWRNNCVPVIEWTCGLEVAWRAHSTKTDFPVCDES